MEAWPYTTTRVSNDDNDHGYVNGNVCDYVVDIAVEPPWSWSVLRRTLGRPAGGVTSFRRRRAQ